MTGMAKQTSGYHPLCTQVVTMSRSKTNSIPKRFVFNTSIWPGVRHSDLDGTKRHIFSEHHNLPFFPARQDDERGRSMYTTRLVRHVLSLDFRFSFRFFTYFGAFNYSSWPGNSIAIVSTEGCITFGTGNPGREKIAWMIRRRIPLFSVILQSVAVISCVSQNQPVISFVMDTTASSLITLRFLSSTFGRYTLFLPWLLRNLRRAKRRRQWSGYH